MEHIAKITHYSNSLGRIVQAGEPVDISDDEGRMNPGLYERAKGASGGRSLEDTINRAIQLNLGTEEELKKIPYSELRALIREGA